MPQATATAAPPDEPPHVVARSYGFLVAPNTVLNVWLPAPNSGVLVLPSRIAPAAVEACDERVVFLRHVVREDRRTLRRAHASRGEEVLVRDGQPGEDSRRRLLAVHRLRGLDRLIGHERDDRIDGGIHALDLRDAGANELGGRDLPRAKHSRELDGWREAQFGIRGHGGHERGAPVDDGTGPEYRGAGGPGSNAARVGFRDREVDSGTSRPGRRKF